jgi:hypothetical protein
MISTLTIPLWQQKEIKKVPIALTSTLIEFEDEFSSYVGLNVQLTRLR